jgi:hypothetical protein
MYTHTVIHLLQAFFRLLTYLHYDELQHGGNGNATTMLQGVKHVVHIHR